MESWRHIGISTMQAARDGKGCHTSASGERRDRGKEVGMVALVGIVGAFHAGEAERYIDGGDKGSGVRNKRSDM
ncbi:hypothetical protein OsI_03239 [Oryza sativa Indica Group]|jgi:hypothetical protein|uniref:Uncharacterized protein n=1 Tax=Oryza sativa subsp. indica TaxID=39946 RepID=A2WTQ0_ORYSI|nr:hypothetical protein OsI_03239 [Oryza sativa Indica Group]